MAVFVQNGCYYDCAAIPPLSQMADKYLSPTEWKNTSKGTAWKAEPLGKALAAFERAEKSGSTEALAALADVEKQAEVLAKANKGDKALVAWLGELDKSLTRRRAELNKAQAAEAKTNSAADGEEDEADEVLLDPKRLLAQFNALKRDPARRVNFGAVDASDKHDALFALSPKMTGRKLFAHLQDLGKVKMGSYGLAWLDEQSLVLQVDNKPMAGLTKKIRAPIRQCGFKVAKILLWDASGAVLEEAGEDPDEAPAPDGPPAGPDPQATAPDPQRLRFEERLAELSPLLQSALGSGHPAAAKLREVLAFARDKAQAAQFAPALQALTAIQKLLVSGVVSPPEAVKGPPPPKADYSRSGRAWTMARTKVADDVTRLRDAIIAEYKGSPMLAEVSAKVRKLDRMVAGFDEDLAMLLEKAGAANDEDDRTRLHRAAADAIRRMLSRLDSDPILSRLKDNPFLPIDPRTALNTTLQVLSRQIG